MTYKIFIIWGDGVGREVITQSKRILEYAAELFGYNMEFDESEGGGEYFHKTGMECPPDTFEKVKAADATIKGPMGFYYPGTKTEVKRPDGRNAGYGPTIEFRKKLELFAMLRPGVAYKGIPFIVLDKDTLDLRKFTNVYTPDNLDMMIVREGTEDAYTEEYEVYPKGETDWRKIEKVISPIVITRKATERVCKFAFDLAKERRKKVACVEKSNAIKAHEYFREIFREVSEKYSGIETDYVYADNFADLVLREPFRFDVAVMPNLIGDILSDEVAGLQGGRGIAPNLDIGDNYFMVETIHGSALDIVGKDITNPLSMTLSNKMLLEWLGKRKNDKRLQDAAKLVENSIKDVLIKTNYRTPDIGGEARKTLTGALEISERARCSAVGDAILAMMRELY